MGATRSYKSWRRKEISSQHPLSCATSRHIIFTSQAASLCRCVAIVTAPFHSLLAWRQCYPSRSQPRGSTALACCLALAFAGLLSTRRLQLVRELACGTVEGALVHRFVCWGVAIHFLLIWFYSIARTFTLRLQAAEAERLSSSGWTQTSAPAKLLNFAASSPKAFIT